MASDDSDIEDFNLDVRFHPSNDLSDDEDEEEVEPEPIRRRVQDGSARTVLHTTDSVGPSETSIRKKAEEFLERSIVDFIQKNCPTEFGNPPVMCLVNHNDTHQISHTSIPITQMCCLTIPVTALVSGAAYFREFDTTTDIGKHAARALRFMMLALCDPSLGTDPNHVDPMANPMSSFVGKQYQRNAPAPKVMPIVEPLFRRHCHAVRVPNARGELVTADGAAYTKTEMFEANNVLGYRVWFMITDPNIDITDAILKRVLKTNKEMGNGTEMLTISETDPGMQGIFMLVFKGDYQKFTNAISKVNTNAAKANALNARTKGEFAARRAACRGHEMLPYEITNVSTVYNFLRVQNNKCYTCKAGLVCERCSTLPKASDAIIDKMSNAEEVALEHEAECAAAAEAGMPLPPPPDHSVTYLNARFSNMPLSSVLASLMNGSMLSKESSMMTMIKEFINPEYYFVHTNPSTLKMLESTGVCARQRDPRHYTDTGSRNHTPVIFPFPDYLFTFSSMDCFDPKFFDNRLPWVYDEFSALITCIEEVAKEHQDVASAEENRDFFESIAGGAALGILQAMEEDNRAIISLLPAQIPIEFQGREYTEADQFFAPLFIDLPNKNDACDNTVVAQNDLITGARLMEEKIERLRGVAKYIDTETMHYLLSILRSQGLRELKRLAVPDSKTSYIMHTASKKVLALVRANKSAYVATPRVAHNLNSSFADYFGHLYFYFESEGMNHNHHILMDLLFATYRAAHCPITDALYKHTTLCNHTFMQGTAGMGKSFIMDVLERMLLEGTISITSSRSARAWNSPDIREGKVSRSDEMPGYFDPGNTNPQNDQMRSEIKEMLTNQKLIHEVPQLSKSDFGEVVSERKTMKIVSHIHDAFSIAGNNLSAIPGQDGSLLSRFTLYIVNQPGIRFGTTDLTCRATPFQTSNINKLIASPVGAKRANMQLAHALHVLYAKGVALGAFAYPNVDMMAVLFMRVYKVMVQRIPSVATNIRMAEQMTARALSITIGHAIYLVFNNPGWSPLVQVNRATGTIKLLPFSLDQLKLVEALTFMPEEAAVSLIAQTFHNSYMPAVYWEIAMQCAQKFANFFLTQPEEGSVHVPNYEKTEINGVAYVIEDYVRCTGTIGDVVRMLNSIGVNSYSARFVLRTLVTTTICCRSVVMYPIATTSSSINVVSASVMARTGPRKTEQRVTMPICKVVAPSDKMSTSFGNENANFEASTLYICVHYLRKFSPDQITRMIVEACCHSGTRQRTIAINTPFSKLPFVMQTAELVPNSTDLEVDFSNNLDSHVEAAIHAETSMFSRRARAAATRRKRHRFTNTDVESDLCLQWLKECVVLPPGVDPVKFTPQSINRTIAERSDSFDPSPFNNYPEDIFSKYDMVLPRFVPPENYNNPIVSDPGSSGIEQPSPRRPDVSRLANVVNRIHRTTPYTASSAGVPKQREHTYRPLTSSVAASLSDEFDEFD